MATARTVTELIQAALRKIKVLGAGDTVKAADTTTGLEALQDIVSALGIDMIPFQTIISFAFASSSSSYTIGEQGSPDKNTTRPEKINGAYIRDSSGYDHIVRIISEREYRKISDKSVTEGRPTVLWYNPTAPNGTVYVHPIPTEGETFILVVDSPFTDPAQLADELLDTTGIPRNYHDPLKHMLALDLAPEYGVEPDAIIIAKAGKGENDLISLNAARNAHPAALQIPTDVSGARRISGEIPE